MEEMKSKRIGITFKYANEERDSVHILPIMEYLDEDTGFKFYDVGHKPIEEIRHGVHSREDLKKIFDALEIENGLQIMDAHIKMYTQNIRDYEERIEELEDEILFYENICAKEEVDFESFIEKLNREIRKRTDLEFILQEDGEIVIVNSPIGTLYESPIFSLDSLKNMSMRDGIEEVAKFVVVQVEAYKQ